MVNSRGHLITVFLCKFTVGQFTITFAHPYTSNWQLGLLESSREETILLEKYAGRDLLSACILSRLATGQATESRLLAKHRMCVSQVWGTEGLHPTWNLKFYMFPSKKNMNSTLTFVYMHFIGIAASYTIQ